MPRAALKKFVYIQNATLARLSKMNRAKITFLIYTSGTPASGTDPTIIGGYAANLTTCVNAMHPLGNKVLLSIFFSKDVLISLVNSATNFPKLVTNIVAAIGPADGCDLDVENYTPDTNDQQIAATDALISALYAKLNPMGKVITLAGYAKMPGAPDVINVSLASVPKLEGIHLMSYDLKYPDHSTLEDTVASLEAWKAAGFPPDKLSPGIPFYAKESWHTSDPMGNVVAFYQDVVDQLHPDPDVNQANVTAINSYYNYHYEGTTLVLNSYVAPYCPVNPPMWWNGPLLCRQKVDAIYLGGYVGYMVFDGGQDYLTDPKDSLFEAMLDEEVKLMAAVVFPPGIAKHPKVSFPTDPLGGLAGTIDFYLSADGGVTRVSGPGPKPFVFGGTIIDITLPAVAGDYKVYWDLYVGAFKVFSYYDINDVIIVPGGTPNPIVW